MRVSFNNMYVFPFKNMYIPNKFPVRAAEGVRPAVRYPARPRRTKKPVAKKNAKKVARTVAQQPVPTAPPPTVQTAPLPIVQSARSVRALQRSGRKKI